MGWLFILPSVVLFMIFVALPALSAFYLSFTDYDILTETEWVGLANYAMLLKDKIFFISLKNIVFYVALYVPLMVVFSLSMAVAVNQSFRGVGVFRTIFYIPSLTSAIAASTVWLWILNPHYGVLNQVLAAIGIVGPAWLAMSSTAMMSIVMVTLWQGAGGNMILFLAGLQGISKELYESAMMDGAGRIQSFFRITLPLMRPTTFLVIILSMIGSFQLFDQAFALTQGGPGYATMTPVYMIYNEGFNLLNMGYASSMAVLLFLVILLFTILSFKLNKDEKEMKK
ncbi:MAG: sugar ABC transporter permease [Spirochaetales bacterium]|nr:sugar ABC transporter permease [Spirochaetales bacterium]